MRWIKRLVVLVIVLLLAAVIGLTAFVFTFNPNDYKTRIEQIVQEKTGRTLTIDGQIHLALFPHLGLRLSRVSLSNPAGFTDQTPFVSIDRLELDVELLPLFSHKLIVNHVVLDGLDLNLIRHANGQANWQGLAGTASKAAPLGTAKPGKPTAAGLAAGAPFALAVAGVDIHGGRVVYDDQRVGRRIVVAPVNLVVGHLAQGRPAPLTLDFHLEDSKPALGLDGHLTAQLSANLVAARYQLNHMTLKLSAKGKPVPQGAIDVLIQSSLDVNLAQTGEVLLKPFTVTMNGSHLTGNVEVRQLTHPHITFTLALDQINADQYFPPTVSAAKGGGSNAGGPSSSSWSNKPLPVPLAEIRRLNISGNLSIGQLTLRKLKLSQIHLALQANQGLVKLSRMDANLYAGAFHGSATLDARRKTPEMTLKAGLDGVQIGDLLKDYAGDSYFTGKTKLQMDLHTLGDSERALVNALDGNMSLAIHNGSVQHSRLASQVQSVLSKLNELRRGTPAGPSGAETQFASLTATGQIKNGVLDNRDLLLNAIQFAANGNGTVNLPKREINYTLRFTQANGKGTPIPLLIRGPLHHPGYEIDLKSMAQGVLQQRLDQEKQKAGEQIKQRIEKAIPGLQGLFK